MSKPYHEGDATGQGTPPGKHDARGPYWRRVHRDWRFWVGVVLFCAAIAIYVVSLDLSSVPHPR